MKKVVYDVETKNTFADVKSANPADLEVSLVVAYDYEADKYLSFWENDFPKLWELFNNTDILIGFNSDHFDAPLLNKNYPGDLKKIKSVDLLHEIKKASGRRASLNAVAAGTLGLKKSGHGLDAVVWWQRGELDKIEKYCRDDVRLTKELYDYAIQNGKLKYEKYGKVEEVLLDTRNWEVTSKPQPDSLPL